MALDENQLATIRVEIGDSEPPDDDDLYDIFLRVGSITDTAIEIIKKRIATLASGGALDFSVSGEYSENRTQNLQALERQLKRLEAQGLPGDDDFGSSSEVVVSHMTRTFTR